MAFTNTVDGKTVIGNKWMAWGTYTNTGGSTGGDINAQLDIVDVMMLQQNKNAVIANVAVTNETFPVDGTAVTIVTDADEDGYWWAIGRQ